MTLKNAFFLTSALVALNVPLIGGAMAAPEPSALSPAPADTTVVYGRDFIEGIPNAVSVIDVIRRIPGGNQLLPQGGGGGGDRGRRGFSSNDDRILINGKRISGKDNDSQSTLRRITVEQVDRIELIRGSSPDIKVSSQESILNIVLRDDISGGSGSFEVRSRTARGRTTWFGGFLSYGGKVGNLDYFASLDVKPNQRTNKQVEESFDALGNLEERLNESIRHNRREIKASTNLIYTFGNGSELRVNGSYSQRNPKEIFDGTIFEPDAFGVLAEAGTSYRFDKRKNPSFEIGADYEGVITDKMSFKILGLFTHKDRESRTFEDYLMTGADVEEDFLSLASSIEKESILRASLAWDFRQGHEFEFGTEFAKNTRDDGLDYHERVDGALQPVVVAGSDAFISELRNESFVIYSWVIDKKWSLESSLFTELSKIESTVDGVANSRDFFFLRPSADLRYNMTKDDQLQFSIRRKVSQLNFGNFTSSVSGDEEVVAGNTELVPEKTWEFEASFEHRLADDQGSVKLRVFHEETEDKITRIEVQPGISGTGNGGHGTLTGVELEGSFRFKKLGLPDLLVEGSVLAKKTELTDPFTGEKHQYQWRDNWEAKANVRYDIAKYGLSFGADFRGEFGRKFYDIDEVISFSNRRMRLHAYVEKGVFGGMIFRVEGGNLIDADWWGRDRVLYDNGRLLPSTGLETRRARAGRQVYLSLKGTF